MSRYGIAEWFGNAFVGLTVAERQRYAAVALGATPIPACPFQENQPPCRKAGGVCSLQLYGEGDNGRAGPAEAPPVITCPARFEQDRAVVDWLAEVVGFPPDETLLAKEIPFMRSRTTDKPAGMIDLVVGRIAATELRWYALEIQAVYFSGSGMTSQFEALLHDDAPAPPYPDRVRRPDWRSSSAKRLMPQLQTKVPTLRSWLTKLAVAVDEPFFASIGGPSRNRSHDVNDGDIIWLVPRLVRVEGNGAYQLTRGHWEVLTLEASMDKLMAADRITRGAFEQLLLAKLTECGRG